MAELSAGNRKSSEGLRDIVRGAEDDAELSMGLRDIVQGDAPDGSESVRALTRPSDPSRVRGTQEFFERQQTERVLAGIEENVSGE
jgi:hypothetical protein